MEYVWPTEANYNALVARIIHVAAHDAVTGEERDSAVEFLDIIGANPSDINHWYQIEKNRYEPIGVEIIPTEGHCTLRGYKMVLIRCRRCGRECLMRSDHVLNAVSCGCILKRGWK